MIAFKRIGGQALTIACLIIVLAFGSLCLLGLAEEMGFRLW